PNSRYLLEYLSNNKNHIKRLRLATLLSAPFKKIIHLDADILFFKNPIEIEAFKKNAKNYISILRPSTYELFIPNRVIDFHLRRILYLHLKLNVHFLINDGFTLLDAHSINTKTLNKIEHAIQFCKSIDYSRTFFADETYCSIFFEKERSFLLSPDEYLNLIYSEEWKKELLNTVTSIHFVSSTKIIFMYQAVKLAIRSRLFSKRAL
ncbi:MAG TPA: hypothetical protein VF465_18240, partial [Flavobacterium sp.]|uniref:hypothetical protein n=1 Tax=Flavobacterium sp. TaxID=239 RepID=UPI002ED67CF6